MRPTIVALTAAEARSAITGGTLAERARQALTAAAAGYMAPDANEVLAAGIAALLDTCDPDERAIVDGEVAVIGHANRVLTAAMTGMPLDWENMPEAPEMPEGAVGLMAITREVVAARGWR